MSIDYSQMAFPKGKNLAKKKRKEGISNKNREALKSLFKGKCGLCGKKGQQIHHIIYRSEDRSEIDDLDNLILLCVECHAKVHSNKEYWQPRLQELREKLK